MTTEVEGTHQIGDVSLYTKTWKVNHYLLGQYKTNTSSPKALQKPN